MQTIGEHRSHPCREHGAVLRTIARDAAGSRVHREELADRSSRNNGIVHATHRRTIVMSINTAMTLKQIVLAHAAAATVLESHRLDHRQNGDQTLAQACRKANLDLSEVLAALARTRPGPSERTSTLTEQAGFILGRHHAFTRAKLPRIEALLARSLERQGASQAQLKAVGACFAELQTMLDSHLGREEQALLPLIGALDQWSREENPPSPPCPDEIEDLISRSKTEHRTVGRLLGRLRELTSDFTPAPDADSTCRAALQALERLETHLMDHIHQENEALFPRVRELARQGG